MFARLAFATRTALRASVEAEAAAASAAAAPVAPAPAVSAASVALAIAKAREAKRAASIDQDVGQVAAKFKPRRYVDSYVLELTDKGKLQRFADQHDSLLHKMRSRLRSTSQRTDRKTLRAYVRSQKSHRDAIYERLRELNGFVRYPRLTKSLQPEFSHVNPHIEDLVVVPIVQNRTAEPAVVDADAPASAIAVMR